jgi:hypothetical protein
MLRGVLTSLVLALVVLFPTSANLSSNPAHSNEGDDQGTQHSCTAWRRLDSGVQAGPAASPVRIRLGVVGGLGTVLCESAQPATRQDI